MAIVTSLALLAAAGCGVRLETPPPTEPVPDAQETLRRVAVEGALLVGGLADAAVATSSGLDPAALDALTQTGDHADQHVTQLGGVYDSGLPEPEPDPDDPDPTPTDEPSTPASATPAEVVEALASSSAALRDVVDQTEDGAFARLVASIAASQDASARRVAAASGTPLPESLVTPTGLLVPEESPTGLSATDLSTIIEAEDAAGYAFELRAALADGDVRAAALERAVLHRARAEAWAQAAGTAGGAQDPRRVAYTVPTDVPTAELAIELESSLTESYAALTADAGAGTRLPLADLAIEASLAAVAWGAPVSAFPGLPEQSQDAPTAG
ncbi:DUF4439 domain-containing protein [Oerskovia sp. Sa1BUA8]|uniref:DUF4439 domain-containing protein n=1 Tax=Oerskovia douganii TaxID=2762210 RepID=A0A9D5YYG4_9CELL|nr:DUF4439 domain-containing protein [Oerskovia douganii]MBE7698859.1 DUF4439 domain-containing protein [Oerskovia douganii]